DERRTAAPPRDRLRGGSAHRSSKRLAFRRRNRARARRPARCVHRAHVLPAQLRRASTIGALLERPASAQTKRRSHRGIAFRLFNRTRAAQALACFSAASTRSRAVEITFSPCSPAAKPRKRPARSKR